jgi:hypothetical protein
MTTAGSFPSQCGATHWHSILQVMAGVFVGGHGLVARPCCLLGLPALRMPAGGCQTGRAHWLLQARDESDPPGPGCDQQQPPSGAPMQARTLGLKSRGTCYVYGGAPILAVR